MVSTALLSFAVASLGLCWGTLSCWVLASRYLHDRGVIRGASDGEGLKAGRLQVGDLSARRLRRVALGSDSRASEIAARAVMQADERALLRRAAAVRASARLRALTIVVRSGSPRAVELVRAAVKDEDPALISGAVRLASDLPARDAAVLLLDVLVEGRHPRSRTATELEPISAHVRTELLELAEHPEAQLRFWAVTLLGRDADDAAIAPMMALRATDLDPSVRAAAAEALGHGDVDVATPILRRLLEDHVFYVRSHAARAIGQARLAELNDNLLPLLADTNWWVRAAAKEALIALGPEGFGAAVAALEHEDRFARDGALEIIVGSDYLRELLASAERGDPDAKALAATIAERRARSATGNPVAEALSPCDAAPSVAA